MLIERIFAGCLAVVSILLVFIAWGFVAPIAYDPLGPRPYPILLLILIIICCFYLTIRPHVFAEKVHLGFTPIVLKKVGLTLLFLFIYALTFEFLGFPIATTIMACVIGMLFGGSFKSSLISGVLIGVLCYILFDYLLDVPLPLGLLSQ